MGRPLHELSSCKRKSSRAMKNERVRILLERQKEQFLSEFRTEIQKHEFQDVSDRNSIQELNEIVESQRREIDHIIAGDEQLRLDQLLLHDHLSEQNLDLREAHVKSLHEMEKLKRFQGSRLDESSRRRLIENQDTINGLKARIQELQNEGNCLIDSKVFKDDESVRSGHSHVASQLVAFPPVRDLGGMLSFSLGMSRRNDGPSNICAWFIGNFFCNSSRVFFSTLSAGIDPLEVS